MQILLNDKEKIELPEGSTAKDLAEKLNLKGATQALAANINGVNRDLFSQLKNGDKVTLWSFDDPQGKEIFWHTSAHVLAQAILRKFPDAKPTIGPPIENGFYYDFANLTISEDDFPLIEKEIKNILKEGYLSKREEFKNKDDAKKHFFHNKYKCEMIDGFPESEELSGYRQGEFFDLCRGPHLPSLGKIKAMKLMKTSGAYWRGDSKNEMLTRIYGVSFPSKEQLDEHLTKLEEAKKRDHRVIGSKLDLFSFREEAPGMPFIHPKGMRIWIALTNFLREALDSRGYVEIKTPTMLSRELWERSGHWNNYKEHMFTSQVENHDYAIKPMNCPGCMLFYKSEVHSYRDLPYRVSEIGHVHRFEHSGSLSGLFRVRAFHQDDAHIFMKPSDIQSEILNLLELFQFFYSTFGLTYHLELSTKPEKNTIGSDSDWEIATNGLKGALDEWGAPYKINEGDGAFYGPKIDFHIKDAIGRTWQCGTIQLDMALPEKFELEYTADDGTRKRPVMLHRAIFGSIERFLGNLIEHFAGKFPLWISPIQVRILTVADRHADYAHEVAKTLKFQGFRVDVDDSGESVGKKIRTAQLTQINYILTVGDQEVENRNINLRTRDNVVHGEIQIDHLVKKLLEERDQRALSSSFKNKES